jgi:hypothetical protein
MEPTQPKRRGRPSKPLEERWPGIVERAKELSAMNMNSKEIADSFGVSDRTIRFWKDHNGVFASALKQGKEMLNFLQEGSLFTQGMGYYYEEEASTKEGVITLRKYQPPNERATTRWLTNRAKEKWQERVELNHTVREVTELDDGDSTTDL